MSDNKPQTQQPTNVFDKLADSETRQLVDVRCVYVNGAVEDYEIDGKTGKTGFIQVLRRTRDDSQRLTLDTIKVRESEYGLIDILNKQAQFRAITLNVEIVERYNKTNWFLIPEQKALKVA